MGLLIKQMRADRSALAATRAEPAPAGLEDDVLTEVDDYDLRAVAAEESAVEPARIPISSYRSDGQWVRPGASENRLAKFAAVAAAFAVVVGSAWYLLRELRPKPPAPATLAVRQPAPPTPMTALAPPVATQPKVVADAVSPPAAPSVAVAVDSREKAEPLAAAPKPAPTPTIPPSAASATTISIGAAVRMAREGRLALVIRPKDSRTTIKRFDSMVHAGVQTTSPGHTLTWRSLSLDRLPPSLAQMATQINTLARRQADDHPLESPSRAASPTVAGGNQVSGGAAPAIGPGAQPSPIDPAPAIRAVFSVEVEPSARGLNELVAVLGEDGQNTIVYRVAETAMSPTISLEPEAVVWWTGPPARWIRPAVVPIVIDARD